MARSQRGCTRAAESPVSVVEDGDTSLPSVRLGTGAPGEGPGVLGRRRGHGRTREDKLGQVRKSSDKLG